MSMSDEKPITPTFPTLVYIKPRRGEEAAALTSVMFHPNVVDAYLDRAGKITATVETTSWPELLRTVDRLNKYRGVEKATRYK